MSFDFLPLSLFSYGLDFWLLLYQEKKQAWGMEHGAWSVGRGAWSKGRGAWDAAGIEETNSEKWTKSNFKSL